MPFHLPVLLNPLLNAVFNCPTPHTSSLRKVFSQIGERKFLVVAPATDMLTEYEDLETGQLLSELCYTPEFVSDHIVMLDLREGIPTDEFRTLSGKSVLVRNQQGILLTGAGFDTRRRCRILEAELMTNFNDYLTASSTYPIINVDFPFTGRLSRKDEWQVFKHPQTVSSSQAKKVGEADDHSSPAKETLSLEQMLRINPIHANQLGEIFEAQRHSLANSPFNASSLAVHFSQTCEKALAVIQKDPNFQHMPNIELHVHEYVELSLYDDFWAQLTNSMRPTEIESMGDYSLLKHIALSQVPSFLYPANSSKFDLRYVTRVEKNLAEAVICFRKLASTNCHSAKAKIIVECLQTLSRGISVDERVIPIDADTLVSLLVVTVCRAGVRDLKSHLFYLQEFAKNSSQITFGILAYGISTLEAVLGYFEIPAKIQSVQANCSLNLNFWSWLSDAPDSAAAPDTLDVRNMLRVRTCTGQSALSFCIQEKSIERFKELAYEYESLFPLEDLLNDEDIEGSNLLIQMLDSGCHDLANSFVDLLRLSCTEQELRHYFNQPNRFGRTSAHYLMHAPHLIKKMGSLLDWEKKDCNGQTPLFAVIRAYDQPKYDLMLAEAYNEATKWCRSQGKQFRSSVHTDSKGNSLLHVAKSNASVLLNDPLVDVNATNYKGLTPLMVYAKYNRILNVESIIKDGRLILERCQRRTYLDCFDYFKNPAVLKEMGGQASKTAFLPLRSVHARCIKSENSEWVLWMTSRKKSSVSVIMRPLRFIQNFMLVFWRANPRTFVPIEETLEELRELCKMTILVIHRLEVHKFLPKASIILSYILQDSTFADAFYSSNLNIPPQVLEEDDKRKTSEHYGLIEPEDMRSIQRVLKFNRAEIMKLKTKAHVMKKLSASGHSKQKDLSTSYHMLAKRVNLLCNSLEGDEDIFPDMTPLKLRPDCNTIASSTSFLQKCTEMLISNIDKLSNVDIPHWWRTYGESASLHHEYQKNFPGTARPNTTTSTGLFASYIETKRSKLEISISNKIKQSNANLLTVGRNIKEENERLAVEFNKFINFKNEFWTVLTIEEHAEMNIKLLRQQLVCMEQSFHSYTDRSVRK
ncbi:LAFA_0F01948g1_1 [Lachancea sp. 'fantastica']|nr:LAFA_0F01948g1_1 [Lachancea sp. 'fantastica']